MIRNGPATATDIGARACYCKLMAEAPNPAAELVEVAVVPKEHAIGALTVRRSVPTVQKRSVGPFVFVDHMGPVEVGDESPDVPPHPHIGIATLTYLFEGSLTHRDSTGACQVIEPGAINWMVAGRGVVHSERVNTEIGGRLHGLQFWVALPVDEEEAAPYFKHYSTDQLPSLRQGGTSLVLGVGEAFGQVSPVLVHSKTLLVEAKVEAGGSLLIPAHLAEQRALYLVSGSVRIGEILYRAPVLLVLRQGCEVSVVGEGGCHLLLLGGEALKERRFMDWNFVSSQRERIDRAKEEYRRGRLGRIPGEGDNLPLPEDS